MHITFSLVAKAYTGSGFAFVGPLLPIKYLLSADRTAQENDKIELGHCFLSLMKVRYLESFLHVPQAHILVATILLFYIALYCLRDP